MKLTLLKNFIKNYFRNTNFYAIFLLKPSKKQYWKVKDYTSSHFNKGQDYHIKFEKFPGRKIIWNLEKKIINDFISNKKDFNHLDFASGTGRIVKFLEKKNKKQHLLDSSKKMLDFARKILNSNKSTYTNKDFTKIKLNKKFNLITAFRFFPNAEVFLRKKAMKFISKHLNDNGILIINNHFNFWSIPFIFSRLTFRSNGFGMTHQEIVELVRINNLKIYDYKSIGLLTHKEKSSIIPWSLVSNFENLFYKINSKHLMGYNVIYLIGK
jgi:ubiquinone/menaquinone biosynthesis C-methylase UbiE